MELQTMTLRFRVWDKKYKKFINPNKIGAQSWDCRFNHDIGCFEMESDERFVVSQDTSLKDKQGKDIFTGDILKYTDEHSYECDYGYVEYNYGLLGVRVKLDYKEPITSWVELAEINHKCDVVGNIWQNAELLEKA